MPGAGYVLSCNACGNETDLTEGANELGGHWWYCCDSCGFMFEQEHHYELACDACGFVKKTRAYEVDMWNSEPCSCSPEGAFKARRVEIDVPTCPEHPVPTLRELLFLDIVEKQSGVPGVP